MFSRQILCEESDKACEAYVHAAAKFLASAIDGIGARRKKLLWDAPPGFCPIQAFLAHITTILSSRFKDPWLNEMAKVLPSSQWSEKWRGLFYTIDVDNLLSLNCGRVGVTWNKSLIRHLRARLGVLA